MPLPAGLRRLFRLPLSRQRVEQDVDDELRFHLETRADDLMRTGMSREAALARARAEFGDVIAARLELTEIDRRREAQAARAEWWHDVLQDARVALRGFRQRPGFMLVIVVTLAVGIGATTAMFSIVNAVLLHPMPYAQPDRLVYVAESHHGAVAAESEASYPDFVDWRAQHNVFAALEGYDETNVPMRDAQGAQMVRGARVTSGFFNMLGVPLYRGRGFVPEDDAPGPTSAVVLSYGMWMSRFGGDEGIIGRTVTIEGAPYEIRGVLPKEFAFGPAGDAQLWLPLGRSAETRQERFNHWVRVVGRLRDGVSVEVARVRMGEVMRDLASRYPETNSGRGIILEPLYQRVVGANQQPIVVLFGAVAIVLLIACANVASLILTRSIERAREIAVRSAIGASRARIVRQLLTENLVLSAAGALLGAWLAARGVDLLVAALPDGFFDQIPALRNTSVDLAALLFTAAVAIGTGLLFGLAPAVLATRGSAAEFLRSDMRTGTGLGRHRLRELLVTSEIALTLVLLVGATLMGRSVVALLRVDPGFRAEGVASVRVPLAGPAYADQMKQVRFFEDALTRVRAIPGVQSAGAISSPPLQGGGTNTFFVQGEPEPPPSSRHEATMRAVSSDYFRALGIPLVQGRALDERDNLNGAPYALVISESLARQLFGSREVIGRQLRIYAWEDSAWTIVGVAGDVKTDALDAPPAPTIYYSHMQGPANRMTIVARAAGIDPLALVPEMRRAIGELDPNIPVYGGNTMTYHVVHSRGVAARRYMLVLLGAFATTALFLAIIGLYGVIAYSVTQRTREMAIRIALGALDRQVVALVLRSGLRLVVVGIVAGAIAAFALSRTLSAMLFGVRAADLPTYGLMSALLVIVTVLATYLPARRATQTDPATALRAE
jgi:predicted permease